MLPTALVIPVLETARLRLRAHTLSDYPDCCALWSDPEVTRYIGGKPQSPEKTWTRLLRHLGHWSLLGFGCWVVEEKASGDFVGEVGLFDYKRNMEPPLGDLPEIGWVLTPAKHGIGYATESVAASLAWADRHGLAAGGVGCLIHPENTASFQVAKKCGFALSHTALYKGGTTQVLLRKPQP